MFYTRLRSRQYVVLTQLLIVLTISNIVKKVTVYSILQKTKNVKIILNVAQILTYFLSICVSFSIGNV